MKTFSELISWELEQEKKGKRSAHIAGEQATGKLSALVLRKLKYLSAAGPSTPGVSSQSFGAA